MHAKEKLFFLTITFGEDLTFFNKMARLGVDIVEIRVPMLK